MSDHPTASTSRDAIAAHQLASLQRLCSVLADRNPFWSNRFRQSAWDPQAISDLHALQRLPLLTKGELVADQETHPPFGTNLTAPLEEYVRLHQTSGTTGRPMLWLDTPDSWSWFLNCWDQIYDLAGVQAGDVFAFPFSFGPFIAFWAAFEGAQRRGHLSLTLGGMTSESRLQMILGLQATVVCCTPTYALRLAEVASQQDVDLAGSAVRLLIVAGEPGASIPAIRERLSVSWGARVIDHWGMTDIGSLAVEPWAAPGGLLVLESECIAEIVAPGGDSPVAPGELGELVITNLGRWSQPVLRYRTGDLVRAATTPCPSGQRYLRLEGGILGRVDDMVTIRGNNVFPSSLDAILREFTEVAEYRCTVQTIRAMPHLLVEVEPATGVRLAGDADHAACQELLQRVSRRLRERLNFQAEVRLAQDLPRFEQKGRRFIRADRDATVR